MIGRPTFSSVLVMLLGSVLAPAGVAEPKNEVAVFQYGGVVGEVPTKHFDVFRRILDDKILQLGREVQLRNSDALAYVKDVHSIFRDKDTFEKTEQVNQWLRNQGSVLCVLRGTIVSDDDRNYMVRSNIYLGELKEYFPDDVVRITLPIKSDQFGNSRDSHSIVILYALAMDAKRRGESKSQIAPFLTTATNKLADVKRRGQGGGDLADLEKAIRAASDELLGRRQ